MRIYPAVDIYDGKCVRLKEGNLAKMEMFYENPVDAAKMWEQKGAKALHIIDLNGAFSGVGFTLAIVLFAGIRERLELAEIPEPLKGFPLAMITAGLMSVAFLGFQGLIK